MTINGIIWSIVRHEVEPSQTHFIARNWFAEQADIIRITNSRKSAVSKKIKRIPSCMTGTTLEYWYSAKRNQKCKNLHKSENTSSFQIYFSAKLNSQVLQVVSSKLHQGKRTSMIKPPINWDQQLTFSLWINEIHILCR